MTQLEYIMNMYPDKWEEMLTAAPYNLKVSRDGQYIMFKYDQLNSDFGFEVVREARGIIFKQEGEFYTCVCHPFHKFFNYGEKYAAAIDWKTAVVTEKVDGSLMKVWYDNDEWHLSTNGTIDAFKAPINGADLTFGDKFVEILGRPLNEFFKYWDQDYTYLFEMTSMDSRVVISYPDRIYALAWIKTSNGVETNSADIGWQVVCRAYGFHTPYEYPFHSFSECIDAVRFMTKDEEGLVVRDMFGNRIKIKSAEYLKAARLENNGAITTERLIEAWKNDRLDDLVAYVPLVETRVKDLINRIDLYALFMEDVRNSSDFTLPRKEFALKALKFSFSRWLFKCYSGSNISAIGWLKSLPTTNLKELLYEN